MREGRRVVAIGPAEEVMGLKSVGVEVMPMEAGQDLRDVLQTATSDRDVAVILVSEPALRGDYRVISECRARTGVVLLVVPAAGGSQDLTMSFLRHTLEQSIGVDLISKE
jgi:vacuolar-type H+-ATPase subunit F/Vma7